MFVYLQIQSGLKIVNIRLIVLTNVSTSGRLALSTIIRRRIFYERIKTWSR